MNKNFEAYKTIGEVVQILSLSSKQKKLITTHTIRFWEKKFKQIRPKILNGNRRYYDQFNIDLLKKIKFLLKDQGLTINGAKKVLNSSNSNALDEIPNKTIRTARLRNKINNITNIIKDLKKLR